MLSTKHSHAMLMHHFQLHSWKYPLVEQPDCTWEKNGVNGEIFEDALFSKNILAA